ncbi:hypothetical protein [Aeromicrobium alkaliterrae]
MMRISYRFEPSEALCPTCSASLVVRVQVAEREDGETVERSRREECSQERLHSAIPISAA